MLQARGNGHQVYKGSGQNLDSHLHYQIMFRSECYYLLLRHTTGWSFVCYTGFTEREGGREKEANTYLERATLREFSFFLALAMQHFRFPRGMEYKTNNLNGGGEYLSCCWRTCVMLIWRSGYNCFSEGFSCSFFPLRSILSVRFVNHLHSIFGL